MSVFLNNKSQNRRETAGFSYGSQGPLSAFPTRVFQPLRIAQDARLFYLSLPQFRAGKHLFCGDLLPQMQKKAPGPGAFDCLTDASALRLAPRGREGAYERSPGLNKKAASREKPTAAAMPPAVAVSPPVKAPSRPLSATAFFTPSAMV